MGSNPIIGTLRKAILREEIRQNCRLNRLRSFTQQNALKGTLFAKYSASEKRATSKNSGLVGLFYPGSWRYLRRTFISGDAALDGLFFTRNIWAIL
jgi:hypothetical protein